MRLIDGDKLYEVIQDFSAMYEEAREMKENVLLEISETPTAAAVLVTRCKDCKYSCKDENGRTCEGYWYELSEYAVPVKDDAFCSYGKPKEGAHADDHD